MTKSRYRFLLRPLLSDSPGITEEVLELEAGPFTQLEASEFARTEMANRTMSDSRIWVCDYAAISNTPPPSAIMRTSRWTVAAAVVITCLAFGYLIGTLLAIAWRP